MGSFVFDPTGHPRKLNLGCGFDLREGYLNVDLQDFHRPDLVADVRDLSMLPSDSFDEVVAMDVLEHLPRSDTARALAEWNRVLRVGGLLRLETSDITACGRYLIEHDTATEHDGLLARLFGTQGYTGDFHLAGFTDLSLAQVLHDAGFHRTVVGTKDGWLLTSVSEKTDGVPDPISLGWLSGFWGSESNDDADWRWSDLEGELLIVNHADRADHADLRWGLSRSPGTAAVVRIRGGAGAAAFDDVVPVPASGEVGWGRRVRLPPGPTRVLLSTDGPRLEVPDVRPLGFRIINPRMRFARGGPRLTVMSGGGAVRAG